MFKVECCKRKTKSRVWVLSDRLSELKILKQAICPICGQKIVIIERSFWNGKTSSLRRTGQAAEELIDKVSCDVLYELIPAKANEKHGFYLNYSEYGRIKRCYSNLSTLKLGLFRGNYEVKNNGRVFA